MWPCVFCGTSWHWFFTSITAQPPTSRLLRESSIESFRRHRTRPALMPQEGVARCVQHRLSAPRARRNLLTHCNEFDSRVSLAFAHVRLCHAALRMTSWLSTLLVISAHRINTERRSLSDGAAIACISPRIRARLLGAETRTSLSSTRAPSRVGGGSSDGKTAAPVMVKALTLGYLGAERLFARGVACC
jgi:hypothetical protein